METINEDDIEFYERNIAKPSFSDEEDDEDFDEGEEE